MVKNKRNKRVVYDVDEAEIKENIMKRPADTRDYSASFAFTLNKLLVEKKIDQDKMAKDLEIASGSISDYRRGKGNPSLDKIRKIADYLGVDCNYLLTGIEAKHYSISDYTGLSNDAINRIHGLDDSNKQILSRIIETDITGVLDYIDSALMAANLATKGKSKSFISELQFDEKNRPFIKLSPKDTVSFFVKKAYDLASAVIQRVVNEKMIEGMENDGKENK